MLAAELLEELQPSLPEPTSFLSRLCLDAFYLNNHFHGDLLLRQKVQVCLQEQALARSAEHLPPGWCTTVISFCYC